MAIKESEDQVGIVFDRFLEAQAVVDRLEVLFGANPVELANAIKARDEAFICIKSILGDDSLGDVPDERNVEIAETLWRLNNQKHS